MKKIQKGRLMKILYVLLAWVLLTLVAIHFAYAKSADIYVPRSLTIIGCEVEEWLTVYDPDAEEGVDTIERMRIEDIPYDYAIVDGSQASYGFKDLEWKITGGILNCKRDIVALQDMGELKGVPSIGADFSRAVGCQMASMSYAPKWADEHPGFWPIAVGCPNPIYTDNGTPNNKEDDRIVGYKMPECPRSINDLLIQCVYDETAI